MECVNLRERFGKRYRVEMEKSYYAERGQNAWTDDPWLQIIPGQYGHIYPQGGSMLAVATKGAGSVAKRLRAMPWIKVVQDGSDGINTVFPVEHFLEVADLIRARRRRWLSPESKARLAAAGAKTRFLPGTHAHSEGRICVPAAGLV